MRTSQPLQPFSYRESQFSPAQAVTSTGLSLTLQRDWRSQGLLAQRTSGQARFSPRDLAEMRMMVKLRELGMSLPDSRAAAEAAASSVLYIALSNYKDALAIDGPRDRGERYRQMLDDSMGDGHLLMLSGAGETRHLCILIQGGRYELLPDTHSLSIDSHTEAAAIVNLQAMAVNLATAAKAPLFTLIPPRDFM